jgi:outer membrane protein assembly factor BamB
MHKIQYGAAHLAIRYFKIKLLTACLMLPGLGSLVASDWPQWRGPNRDGKAAGFSAPETWPKQLVQKWKVTVGVGDSTPALVGDKLYVFGRQENDEIIQCLDTSSGKRIWEARYPAGLVVTGPPARHPGTRSSLVVAGGKICALGVGGILSCLHATSRRTSGSQIGGPARFHVGWELQGRPSLLAHGGARPGRCPLARSRWRRGR